MGEIKKYINANGKVVSVDIDLLPLSHAKQLKEFTAAPEPDVLKTRKAKKDE